MAPPLAGGIQACPLSETARHLRRRITPETAQDSQEGHLAATLRVVARPTEARPSAPTAAAEVGRTEGRPTGEDHQAAAHPEGPDRQERLRTWARIGHLRHLVRLGQGPRTAHPTTVASIPSWTKARVHRWTRPRRG